MSNHKSANILISGVGGPTPLGIAKSLKQATGHSFRLIGMDADTLAPGLYNHNLFDKTYRVPRADDPDYWNEIDRIVKQETIDFAFIVPETEVLVWSRRKQQQALPCNCLIPDYNIADVLYDKLRVADHLKGTGLVPETIAINDIEDANTLEREIGYPYWVRIKSGAGALGALKINDLKDIKNWFAINETSQGSGFIASPYLPGGNYACKLLYKNGELIFAATAERVGYLLSASAPSGVSGMCAHGKLINKPELIEKADQALRLIYKKYNIEINGMFTIDFKADKNGIPLITEINIRHVSFTYAFTLGGANFALKTLEAFYFQNPVKPVRFTFDTAYRFIRGVDSELFILPESGLRC